MSKKSGIPLGFLWGLLIIALYVYAFLGIGFYLVWSTKTSSIFYGWLRLFDSSLFYALAGIICFIPTLMISIYFMVRDRNLMRTIKNHWPVIVLILYPFLPNLPGPLDEVFVGAIAASLEAYFVIRRKQIEGKSIELLEE